MSQAVEEKKYQYFVITNVDELPTGERLFVEIGERAIVVFNIAGNLYAIADVCSHDNGPLGDGELEGFEISCPRHGARFDVRCGKVLSFPAVVDIPSYPVRIREKNIEIGIPQ